MRTTTALLSTLGILAGLVALRMVAASRRPRTVAGAPKTLGKLALEVGAGILQRSRPLERFVVHLAGFHPLRDDPWHQTEAHRFCRIVNEDLIECIIFDGDGPEAVLTGVEYIVSERLFDLLPDAEKPFWHPHNFEILSGQLVAPGLPAAIEKRLMKRLLNSYGKTWHLWKTAEYDPVPSGEAWLAWSFNHDGEVDPDLVVARDRRIGVSSHARRRQRADLERFAFPQAGEDVLVPAFATRDRANPRARRPRRRFPSPRTTRFP